jgi:fatty-acyl-CoA synthase
MDHGGYVKIVGRIKDMIIRGGENISPREVEELLHSHAEVVEAQVIGVPSERYGEEVMAWVRLKPGATVTATGLEDFCNRNIACFKVPKHWKFVDEFPMTVTGKCQKFRMREISIAELGLQKAAGIPTA